MWEQVILIFANIATILGCITYVVKLCRPLVQMNAEFQTLKKDVESIKGKLKSDKQDLEELAEESKLQCVFMVNMADHIISGNGVEEMKKTRDKILEHIAGGAL